MVFDPTLQVGKNIFAHLENPFYLVPVRDIEGVVILFDELATGCWESSVQP